MKLINGKEVEIIKMGCDYNLRRDFIPSLNESIIRKGMNVKLIKTYEETPK